ncbi:HEPN domain-containing protein [Pseudacidovorax intermedius]|uniref:HEPN domain-containing protein n=1 Tax=Pseudacidovorax intermedius TaxID=433924 RepID=UPI00034A78F7|nr:HEPN domain-containing protein [Pseudacidovorax intermedius]
MKASSKSQTKPEDQLEAVFNASRIGNFWEDYDRPYRTFGDLVFEGDAYRILRNSLKSLHRNNPEILKTVSTHEFEKKIVNKIREIHESKNKDFRGIWSAILSELKASPTLDIDVIHEIKGIVLKNRKDILQLGPFKILSFEDHQDYLKEIGILSQYRSSTTPPSPHYLISVRTQARDPNRAYEIAKEYFEGFERLLAFLSGQPADRIEVGITNYRVPTWSNFFAVSGKSIGSSSGWNVITDPVPIDDDFFRGPGIQGFWNLIVDTGTELERRLLLAANWIGQSYADRSAPSSFLKSAIALETLFTPNENSIITPSILSSLSESTAMVLGDTAEQRPDIERHVKRLYEQRSAITHRGATEVDPLDTRTIQAIARAAVLKIFKYKDKNKLHSQHQLQGWIKMNKYASPALFSTQAP